MRRTQPLIIAAAFVLVALLVVWFLLPRLVMLLVQASTPRQIAEGRAFITAAGIRDAPSPSIFRLVLTPAETHLMASQEGWRPRALFGAGQTIDGTMAANPQVTWSVHLSDAPDLRGVRVKAPASLINQLMAKGMNPTPTGESATGRPLPKKVDDTPWTVVLEHLRVVDRETATRERRRLSLVAGGTFDLRGALPMHLVVRRIEMDLDVDFTGEGPTVTPRFKAVVRDLATDPPSADALRELIGQTTTKALQDQAKPLPSALPLDLPIQVDISQ